MKLSFIVVICWVVFVETAFGASPWEMLDNPPEPIPLRKLECLEGEEWRRVLRTFEFSNDHEEVQLVFAPEATRWTLALKRNGRSYRSHPYTSRDESMGVLNVYAKDLNHDGNADFLVELVNGGFNGLNAGLKQLLLIFSQNDGSPIIHSCWTWGSVAKGLVDMDGDGRCEIILAELVQPGCFPELGDDDYYWVYHRYELKGMEFMPIRTPGWPIWKRFSTSKNLKEDRPMLTWKQKDAMWADYTGYSTHIETTELTDEKKLTREN